MRARRGAPVGKGLPGVLLDLTEGNNLGYRQGTRVHFFPGSLAPVSADLGPPCSRPARYHFHALRGWAPAHAHFFRIYDLASDRTDDGGARRAGTKGKRS